MKMVEVNVQEDLWKGLISSANSLFESKDWSAALLGYKAALVQAESLNKMQLACEKEAIPFVQIYIISCMNLSNTYEELGDFESAERLLRRIVYYLIHLLEERSFCTTTLLFELQRATLTLLRFLGDQGKTAEQELLLQALPDELVGYFPILPH